VAARLVWRVLLAANGRYGSPWLPWHKRFVQQRASASAALRRPYGLSACTCPRRTLHLLPRLPTACCLPCYRLLRTCGALRGHAVMPTGSVYYRSPLPFTRSFAHFLLRYRAFLLRRRRDIAACRGRALGLRMPPLFCMLCRSSTCLGYGWAISTPSFMLRGTKPAASRLLHRQRANGTEEGRAGTRGWVRRTGGSGVTERVPDITPAALCFVRSRASRHYLYCRLSSACCRPLPYWTPAVLCRSTVVP